jgi:hypothetical protein
MADRFLGIRWTVGDVSALGFEALRLSVWGARKAFGPDAGLVICVNSIPIEEAQRRAGHLPEEVEWRMADEVPSSLKPFLDDSMAEGVAWKLAPPRTFPDLYELSLDNDCVLWDVPEAVEAWLEEPEGRCLIAADDTLAHGAFTHLTRSEPRNTGIRGLPPGFDLEVALQRVLERHPIRLRSELDEQGLQVVALDLERPAHVVGTEDVSICSPFWPHKAKLGRTGAHFVGLNAKELPWFYYDRPASDWVAENWQNYRPELYAKVGLEEQLQ